MRFTSKAVGRAAWRLPPHRIFLPTQLIVRFIRSPFPAPHGLIREWRAYPGRVQSDQHVSNSSVFLLSRMCATNARVYHIFICYTLPSFAHLSTLSLGKLFCVKLSVYDARYLSHPEHALVYARP